MVKINITIEGKVDDAIFNLKKLIIGYDKSDINITSNRKFEIDNYNMINPLVMERLTPDPKSEKESEIISYATWNRDFVKQIVDSNNEQNISIYNEINTLNTQGTTINSLVDKLNISHMDAYRFLGIQTRIVKKINKDNKILLKNPIIYDKNEKKFYINTLFSDLYHSIYKETKKSINNKSKQITELISKDDIEYTPWKHDTINKLVSALNINNQIILHELKSTPNNQITVQKLCENLSITPQIARAFHIAIITVTKRLNRENDIILVPAINYERHNKTITMNGDFANKFYDK